MSRLIPQFATAAAVTALLALGASGAWAQSSMSSPPAASPPRSTAPATNPASSSATPMKNPLMSEDTSQIDGSSVAGTDGSKVGTISTVLMDPSSKKIDRLVVAEGGVLGVGAHRVALPVDAFRWDAQNHNFVIEKTADDLKAMPEWQQPQLAENPNAGPATKAPSAGAAATGPAAAAPIPAAPRPTPSSGTNH